MYVLFPILTKTLQGYSHVPAAGMIEAQMLGYLPTVLSAPYHKGQRTHVERARFLVPSNPSMYSPLWY